MPDASSRMKHRSKSLKKQREKLSPSASGRVSSKISHLVKSGEVPNTEKGRKRAAAMAHSMERAGRLGARGGYKRK